MAVTAVRFENGNGSIERLGADLCIDASGRGNLCLGLLQSIGQAPPAETVIGVDIGYATAVFAIPQDLSVDWKGVRTFAQSPQSSRAGLMLPLEGNCWMLTLGGRCADKPPGDRDGFLAYAQQLRTPTIYNAVRGARQLGEAVRFGFPASVWRHFEQVEPVSAWIIADWRCAVPVQSHIWSRHERGCTASASAAAASSQASARTRTLGGTRARLSSLGRMG